MRRFSDNSWLLILAVVLFLYGTVPATAGVIYTYDAPGVQSSSIAGVTTETFDSGASSGVIGTYIGGTVLPGTAFGGVFGGANGSDYLGANDEVVTLDLISPQKYFGLWWSAIDPGNELALYDQNTELISVSASNLMTLLTPAHFDNPNGGGNPVEQYVYLHFAATGSSNFTRIEFRNGPVSYFESDNHSVADFVPSLPGTVVVPEPNVGLIAGMLVATPMLAQRRRNRQR